MRTKIKEALTAGFALLLALLLFLFWAAKKVVFLLFIIGLLLPLLPATWVEVVIRWPLFNRASPIFVWLSQHGLHLVLVLSFLMILSLHRKINRLQSYQQKQAYILGGLMQYLEVSDFRFSYAIEEAKQHGLSLDRLLNQWGRNFFGKFIGGEEGGESIAGTDPFDTAFKRGDKIATLRDDIKRHTDAREG